MKILIEAYSCEPEEGSEKGVGWHTVCQLAGEFRHDLTVMTRSANRTAIEGSSDPRSKLIHWIFIDPPNFYNYIKKRGGLGLRIYNMAWQREMRKAAARYLESNQIDVLHRLTFGSIVPATLLARFDFPLVVGPAGGAEMTPFQLAKGLPLRHRIKDSLRSLFFGLAVRLPSTRKAYQNCSIALGATTASVAAFQGLGVKEVRLVPQSGCGGDEVEEFAKLNPDQGPPKDGPIRILTASRLIHWKAVALVIEAVHQAIQGGVEVQLEILENGPELKNLRKMVANYELGDRVKFLGRLPSLQDVYARIRGCDALIHPALNEAFGQVVLESLALGRQVICLDWAGPGMIVTEDCGLKIQPRMRGQVVKDFAAAIRSLRSRRESCSEIQEAAVARSKEFSWRKLAAQIDQSYRDSFDKLEGSEIV